MVVHTQETDDLVERAQKDTLEFILLITRSTAPFAIRPVNVPFRFKLTNMDLKEVVLKLKKFTSQNGFSLDRV